MSIKVLLTSIGQQIIADVKQVENTETGDIIAYWLREPRLVHYQTNEENGQIEVRFLSTCTVAVTTEYSVRADHIASILDPREDVLNSYRAQAFPTLRKSLRSLRLRLQNDL